jgi:hypothetical protein
MVTASHNPPSDNAVKCYWSTGGQLLPPHDKGVIDEVMACTTITRIPFAAGMAEGKIAYCQEEVDAAYLQAVQSQSFAGPRDLKIIYSPLHGVGAASILPLLERDDFKSVELFGPHAEPNGDFPNVPGHVSNPENPAVFDAMIARAKETGAELILATDPDADRLGVAAPVKTGGEWRTLSGNQIGVLLQLNSGLPINIPANRDLNGDGVNSDRPLFVARNPLYMPVRKNVDIRYTRWIPIQGSVRAEIIAELKNAFNIEQLNTVTTNTVVDALGNPAAPIPTDPYLFVNPSGFEQRKFRLGFKVRF